MKYRIFFFLSLLLMPLSAGGLFLAFLSLPTTSLLFCITELFSATASLSAILFFRFFSDGKRTEHKKRTCSVKATAGSILHSGATIIQPAERYYPQQKILLSSSGNNTKSNPLRAIYRSTFFSGVTLTSSFQK